MNTPNTPREFPPRPEYEVRAFTPAAAIPGAGALYVHGDLHYVSAKIMKQIVYATIGLCCLAVGLVAGIIGLLLGQPITLFPPHGKK